MILLDRLTPRMKEFIRFCIVGTFATLIDAAVFYIVRQFTCYQIALVGGYVLSLIVNYFLTVLWTFRQKPTMMNALGVLVAHMINLFVVRMSLMYLFVDMLGINDRIAYIPTLLISMFTNYIVVRYAITRA